MSGPRNQSEGIAIAGLQDTARYNPEGAGAACDKYLGEKGERRYGGESTSLASQIDGDPKYKDIQGMCKGQFDAAAPGIIDRAMSALGFGKDNNTANPEPEARKSPLGERTEYSQSLPGQKVEIALNKSLGM